MTIGLVQIILCLLVLLYFYGYFYNYKLAERYNRNGWLWVFYYFLVGPISTIILLIMGRTRVT